MTRLPMNGVIEFDAPIRIESANVTRDRHWAIRKRKTDEQRIAVALCFAAASPPSLRRNRRREQLPPFPPPYVVTITRIAPRGLDDDNAIAGAKAVRDQLAACLGLDDGDARLTWLYAQRRGKPREYAIHVRIESVEKEKV